MLVFACARDFNNFCSSPAPTNKKMTSCYSVSSARLSAGVHSAVTSGYLLKEANYGHVLSRWHRRFYVLYSDGLLCSFKSSRSSSPNKVIPVGRQCLRMRFGSKTLQGDCKWPKRVAANLRFSVVNSDRAYHFCCDTERDLANWQYHLSNILNKLTVSSVMNREALKQSEMEHTTSHTETEAEHLRSECVDELEHLSDISTVQTNNKRLIVPTDEGRISVLTDEQSVAVVETTVDGAAGLEDSISSSASDSEFNSDDIVHKHSTIDFLVEDSFNQISIDP